MSAAGQLYHARSWPLGIGTTAFANSIMPGVPTEMAQTRSLARMLGVSKI